jgi:hypothetical protein
MRKFNDMSREATLHQASMQLLSSNRSQLIKSRNSTYALSGRTTRAPSRHSRGDHTPGSLHHDESRTECKQDIALSEVATPLKQMLEEAKRRKQKQVSRDAQIAIILKAKLDSSCELETEDVQTQLYTDMEPNLPTLEGVELPPSCCQGGSCSLL